MCLAVLVAAALGVAWLRRSRLGTDMLAVRANERSAAASGIDVPRTKLAAFAIGAFLAGLAGSLMAYQQTLATPEPFTVFLGITLFAIMYIAGITSITGAVLAGIIAPGGLLFLLVDRFLHIGDYYAVISGILLIVTIMVNPDGIAGKLPRIPWPSRRRTSLDGTADASEVEPVAAQVPASKTGGPLLSVQNLDVKYGAVHAVSGVSFDVRAGEIVGLIGPNGAGKTTVIDAVTGFAPATGAIVLDGEDVSDLRPYRLSRRGLGRSFQDVELYDDLSVVENVTVGAARGHESSAVAVSERVRRSSTRWVSGMSRMPRCRPCPKAGVSWCRWPACWSRRRKWRCSTNRPQASTAPRAAGSATGSAPLATPVRRSCSSITTWNSSSRSATASSSWIWGG